MSKLSILLFLLLSWVTGNPLIAIIIILAVVYFLDRRYVGVMPSIAKPFRSSSKIRKLRTQLASSPFDVSSKRELARLLIESKKYAEAYKLLEEAKEASEDSAEYWSDLGAASIGLQQLQDGEQQMLQALHLNERVKYGQPYLQLATAFKDEDPQKALDYASKFGEIQSSSSEAYYLLGSLYQSLGRKDEARQALGESISIYRSLPKYKKRHERGWALRSAIKRNFL